MNSGAAAFFGYGMVAVVLGALVTIFWMYVAWRAMKAHERLAQSAEKYVAIASRPKPAAPPPQRPISQ
jgi:uncharacterized membrane protein